MRTESIACWKVGERCGEMSAYVDLACPTQVCVEVARWIGERLSKPYEYKYLLSRKDKPMDAFRG